MWRILFLILILFSSITFSQAQEKPKVIKIDEFGLLGGSGKERFQNYAVELANDPLATLTVINYRGFHNSSKELAIQLKKFDRALLFLRIDRSRVTIVDGGYRKEFISEFWIVPQGAEPPKPSNNVTKFEEFGIVSEKVWKAKFDKLLKQQSGNCNNIIYLLHYGNKKTASKSAKKYLDYLAKSKDCDLNPGRIVITDGGFAKKQKTEVWIIPPGIEPPTPNPNKR